MNKLRQTEIMEEGLGVELNAGTASLAFYLLGQGIWEDGDSLLAWVVQTCPIITSLSWWHTFVHAHVARSASPTQNSAASKPLEP